MEVHTFNRLLKRIRTDPKALETLSTEFYARIKLHVHRRFSGQVSGEDAAQEVFLKLMAREEVGYIDYPVGWLYTLADHYAIDVLRKRGRETELGEWDLVALPASHEGDEVVAALNKLDPLTRKIIYLHIWEGYSYKEIAHALGMNYSGVRTRVSRGYSRMKKFL